MSLAAKSGSCHMLAIIESLMSISKSFVASLCLHLCACHLPPATCHLPDATCHLPHGACHASRRYCLVCKLSCMLWGANGIVKAHSPGRSGRRGRARGRANCAIDKLRNNNKKTLLPASCCKLQAAKQETKLYRFVSAQKVVKVGAAVNHDDDDDDDDNCWFMAANGPNEPLKKLKKRKNEPQIASSLNPQASPEASWRHLH